MVSRVATHGSRSSCGGSNVSTTLVVYVRLLFGGAGLLRLLGGPTAKAMSRFGVSTARVHAGRGTRRDADLDQRASANGVARRTRGWLRARMLRVYGAEVFVIGT